MVLLASSCCCCRSYSRALRWIPSRDVAVACCKFVLCGISRELISQQNLERRHLNVDEIYKLRYSHLLYLSHPLVYPYLPCLAYRRTCLIVITRVKAHRRAERMGGRDVFFFFLGIWMWLFVQGTISTYAHYSDVPGTVLLHVQNVIHRR